MLGDVESRPKEEVTQKSCQLITLVSSSRASESDRIKSLKRRYKKYFILFLSSLMSITCLHLI